MNKNILLDIHEKFYVDSEKEEKSVTVIKRIVNETSLFSEVGGGIRSMEIVEKYLDAGVGRVILGTAAVSDPDCSRQLVLLGFIIFQFSIIFFI